MELVGEVGGRLVPIPRVPDGAVSAGVFLSDVNLSLHPQAPREPVTFQPLSAFPLLSAAAVLLVSAAAAVALMMVPCCSCCLPNAAATLVMLLLP